MIRYKKRRKYKYNLHSDLPYSTGIKVDALKISKYSNKYLSIDSKGKLLIKKGYSWDGPSGPAFDTKNFMQGSLVHDALYQLMRDGVIDQTERKRADEILREICRQDGMSRLRAWGVYRGVRLGGKGSAKPDMLTAP